MRRSTTIGSFLFSNSTKKMPRAGRETKGPELVDALDLSRRSRPRARVPLGCTSNVRSPNVVVSDSRAGRGRVEVLLQEGDELFEGLNGAELVDVRGSCSVELHPAFGRTGGDANGGLQWLEVVKW